MATSVKNTARSEAEKIVRAEGDVSAVDLAAALRHRRREAVSTQRR
jgi:hypothetical protein